MAGKIVVKNVSGNLVGSVVSVHANSGFDIHVEDIRFQRILKVVEERDPMSLAESLGLPVGTPPADIIDAAKALSGYAGPEASKEDVLKSLPIWTYIQRASDSSAVIQALVSLGSVIGAAFA
ncbi:hypothetical protein GLGCALEP_04309 [Pseudomonas sp. MM221]|nr:hypothetical protein DBADOPDK_04201 [Pseudomonas sp. MM223]CAI3807089.1 hypothetical protein GLGCALEP_04309 [Pseudomonas sp. MM221]